MGKAKKIDPAARQQQRWVDEVQQFAERWTPKGQADMMREHARQILADEKEMPAECLAEARHVLIVADVLDEYLADEKRDKQDAAGQGIRLALAYARMLEQRWVGAHVDSVRWRGVWFHDMSEQDRRLLAKLETCDRVPVDDLMPRVAESKSALRKHRATLNRKLQAGGSEYRIATSADRRYVIVEKLEENE